MQNKSIKPEPEYFKCPECGHRTELEYSGAISITKCERCRLFGNRNLWDKWADSERSCLEWRKAYDCLETELDRTRKALDVALCSLQDIAESNGDFITGASTPLDEHEYADMMLDKIKSITKGSDNE